MHVVIERTILLGNKTDKFVIGGPRELEKSEIDREKSFVFNRIERFRIESITMSGTTDAKVRSRLSFLPDYNDRDLLS